MSTQNIDNESTQKVLIIDETKYKTSFTKKFENRKNWKKADPSIISSVIPGTVSKLFVKEKDKLKQGDKLLILDAMKMKNTIKIPYTGTVIKIHIQEGQSIPKGFVMIELSLENE